MLQKHRLRQIPKPIKRQIITRPIINLMRARVALVVVVVAGGASGDLLVRGFGRPFRRTSVSAAITKAICYLGSQSAR